MTSHFTRPAALLFLVLCSSCMYGPGTRNVPATEDFVSIDLSASQAASWRYHHDIAADLDGDGIDETVTLYADVTMSSSFLPLWEDGHRWAAVISDGSHATIVYASFVPNGFVEAAVSLSSSDGRREVIILERTPTQLRTMVVGYDGPGLVRPASVAYYPLDSWLPGAARLSP